MRMVGNGPGRHDAAALLLLGEQQEGVARAALLEGARELGELPLEMVVGG